MASNSKWLLFISVFSAHILKRTRQSRIFVACTFYIFMFSDPYAKCNSSTASIGQVSTINEFSTYNVVVPFGEKSF